MTKPLVQLTGLRRTFDVSKPWLERLTTRASRQTLVAVDNVHLTIGRGETIALVGESGSGKTTLARMMVGLLRPCAGSVTIDGTDIWAAESRERQAVLRRVQMVFQDPYASLNPRWRVNAIVAEPLQAFGLVTGKTAQDEAVGELLGHVGLAPQDRFKHPHAFSGGQRQRIAVARALAARPSFLVCDEPTSALDVSVQAQVLNLLRDLQNRFGLTYLLISHNLAVVRHMATRVGVMYLGRIIEEAPSEALFAGPKHPYTRMLLDAVPELKTSGRQRLSIQGEVPDPIAPPSGCHFHPRCPLAFDRCRTEVPGDTLAGPVRVACHAVAASPP